jgi:hypothetical protein
MHGWVATLFVICVSIPAVLLMWLWVWGKLAQQQADKRLEQQKQTGRYLEWPVVFARLPEGPSAFFIIRSWHGKGADFYWSTDDIVEAYRAQGGAGVRGIAWLDLDFESWLHELVRHQSSPASVASPIVLYRTAPPFSVIGNLQEFPSYVQAASDGRVTVFDPWGYTLTRADCRVAVRNLSGRELDSVSVCCGKALSSETETARLAKGQSAVFSGEFPLPEDLELKWGDGATSRVAVIPLTGLLPPEFAVKQTGLIALTIERNASVTAVVDNQVPTRTNVQSSELRGP